MESEMKFYGRIEDMPTEELHARVKNSMTAPLTYKGEPVTIKPIPYCGEIKSWISHEMVESPELVSRCPMTGIHDLYKLKIEYVPNELIPELKSLKFYLYGYQNLPISHEHILARICRDFNKVIQPQRLRVRIWTAPRGEITTVVCYDSRNLDSDANNRPTMKEEGFE